MIGQYLISTNFSTAMTVKIRLYFFSDDDCIPRIATHDCTVLKNRGTCLTSKDTRPDWLGSNCVWCPDGACSGSSYQCEPEAFLEDKGVGGFERCIHGKIDIFKSFHIKLWSKIRFKF